MKILKKILFFLPFFIGQIEAIIPPMTKKPAVFYKKTLLLNKNSVKFGSNTIFNFKNNTKRQLFISNDLNNNSKTNNKIVHKSVKSMGESVYNAFAAVTATVFCLLTF